MTAATDRRHIPPSLIAIVAVGVVLRVVGVQFGLPAVYNPDEVAIMARALSFAKGTLNPHNFLYPTFYFYVLFVWVGAYLAWVWITGQVASIGALQRLYFTNPTGIYTAGRLLGVTAGTATIVAAYRLAARTTDQRSALAAAAFLAIAPLHVRDSHYVKHDVPATLAVVVAYLAMTRIWPRNADSQQPAAQYPGSRDTALAAAACGVAFSVHYYCIFLAIPLAWTIIQAWRPQGATVITRQLALAGFVSAMVFFALSPFLALEPVTAWRDVTANRAIVLDRAAAGGAFAPAHKYMDMLWRDTMGLPVVIAALAGIVWMLVLRPTRAIQLLAFPAPYLAFICNTAPASRYLNPVLPFLAIFSGWALARAIARVPRGGWLFWPAVLICALPGALGAIRADLFFRQDDTRTLARSYIEANIPSGTSIMLQPYSVPLTPSRQGLVEALTHNLGRAADATTKFQLQLSLDPYPQPAYRLIYLGRGGLDADKIYVDSRELGGGTALDPLRRLGVAFVIIKRYNNSDPDTLAFLTTLAREGRRIAVFSPYRPGVTQAERERIEPFLHNTDTRITDALERPGPPLEIWQLEQPNNTSHRDER